MPERWVVDASPLIALGSIRRLDLLTSLAEDIVVPEAVASEVLRVADEASRAFAERAFRTTAIEPHEAVSRWGLGRGETAVLTFARSTPGYVAIIDDLSARRCAAALGISVRGTLGVVLLAKRRGRHLLGPSDARRASSRGTLPVLGSGRGRAVPRRRGRLEAARAIVAWNDLRAALECPLIGTIVSCRNHHAEKSSIDVARTRSQSRRAAP